MHIKNIWVDGFGGGTKSVGHFVFLNLFSDGLNCFGVILIKVSTNVIGTTIGNEDKEFARKEKLM